MPSFLILLLLVTALPLCGFGLLLALGRRMDEPLGGYVGTAFAFSSFAAAVAVMVKWIGGEADFGYQIAPLVQSVAWLPIGNFAGQRVAGFLDVTLYVDSFTVVMLAMMTLVSSAVHLYSIRYMRDDPRYVTYFARLSLFGFSMTGLLLSGTLLQLLIFWELVGLCSYLLIGFWHERRDARNAATKAFLTNRVGDVGFIVGMGLLASAVGNTTLPALWATLAPGHASVVSPAMLTVIGCLLFCGAMGKSAQFPLHTWLPDAMAGPTPVSALIHAATMVAAGVFLLIRIDPILTNDAHLFVTVIGAVTIAVGSMCALAQRDIKQALAFSTMAQLGYMVLGVGVGSRDGAGFHLLTHAFFKALLFLSAGVVIHGMHHRSRLEHYGGLYRKMPVATIAFAVGALAMSAAPFLSGFYSKEMLLAHAAAYVGVAHDAGRGRLWGLILWVPVVGAYLTPFYLTRLWMLTFAGRTRDLEAFNHAREPGLLAFPLVVLSGLTIVSGYAWFPLQSMVEASGVETQAIVAQTPNTVDPLLNVWPAPARQQDDPDAEVGVASDAQVRVEVGAARAASLTRWAWLVGILGGMVCYIRGFATTDRLARHAPVDAIREWLRRRMYFDDLYHWVFVGVARGVGRWVDRLDRHVLDTALDGLATAYARLGGVAATVDDAVVDGAVRGITAGVAGGGLGVVRLQGGRVRTYVASAMVVVGLGVAAAVGYLVWR